MEALSTPDFVRFFLDGVRSGRLPLLKWSPALKQAVTDYLSKHGVSPASVEKYWDKIYRRLLKLRSTAKTGKKAVAVARLTPATVIYYAYYEIYGPGAPEKMYLLLEPILTSALQGDASATRKAQLLFMPITPSTVDDVLQILQELISKSRDLCRPEATRVLSLLCSRGLLPTGDGRRVKDTNYCMKQLTKIIDETCRE